MLNEWNWNRLVDRDMIMRYHWGAGVGHIYTRNSHIPQTNSSQTRDQSQSPVPEEDTINLNVPSKTPEVDHPIEGGAEPHNDGLDGSYGGTESESSSRSGSESSSESGSDSHSEEEDWKETYGSREDPNPGGSCSYD